MLEINKHERWRQLQVSVSDYKCGIGILSIFDVVFSISQFFLWYWVPPPCCGACITGSREEVGGGERQLTTDSICYM